MHMLCAKTMKLPRSILYQRGIYPSDSFEQQKQYGLSIMVSTDEGLTGYLTTVLRQMSGVPLNQSPRQARSAASPCRARQRQAFAAVSSCQRARQHLLVQWHQACRLDGTAGHGLFCSIPAGGDWGQYIVPACTAGAASQVSASFAAQAQQQAAALLQPGHQVHSAVHQGSAALPTLTASCHTCSTVCPQLPQSAVKLLLMQRHVLQRQGALPLKCNWWLQIPGGCIALGCLRQMHRLWI